METFASRLCPGRPSPLVRPRRQLPRRRGRARVCHLVRQGRGCWCRRRSLGPGDPEACPRRAVQVQCTGCWTCCTCASPHCASPHCASAVIVSPMSSPWCCAILQEASRGPGASPRAPCPWRVSPMVLHRCGGLGACWACFHCMHVHTRMVVTTLYAGLRDGWLWHLEAPSID